MLAYVCVCVCVCIDLLGQSTYVTVTGILLLHSELPRGSVGNHTMHVCIYAMHVCPGLQECVPELCLYLFPVSSMAAFGALHLLFDYGPQPITNLTWAAGKGPRTTSTCLGMQPYGIAVLSGHPKPVSQYTLLFQMKD